MRRLLWCVVIILPCMLFITNCSRTEDYGLWRGRIEVVKGVFRVISDAPIRHPPDQLAEVMVTSDMIIRGREDQSFTSIYGVTTDENGGIYVADAMKKQILKFSEDGQFVASVGSEGVGPLQFIEPVDMVLDPQGRLYVLDSQLDRVTVLNPDLSFADIWNTQVTRPRRIRVDTEGNILIFVITQHDLIHKFTPDGNPIAKFYNPLEGPRLVGGVDDLIAYSDAMMETTENGYVIVSARHPYWIRKFDRVNGLELEFKRSTGFDMAPTRGWEAAGQPPPLGSSNGLALLPDGRIMNVVDYHEFKQIGLDALGLPRLDVTRSERWYDFFTHEGRWEMTAQLDVKGIPMHVDRRGRIYFAELESGRIVRYNFVFPEDMS